GSRQEFTAVHRVPPLPSGREMTTAHAPHSPSAHPSFTLVRPLARRKFRAVVCAPTSLASSSRLLTVIVARVREIAASVMASSCLTGQVARLHAGAWFADQ